MHDEGGDRGFLRAYLADRDVACPQCGYNLRALTGDTCPECGEKLALGVRMVEPKQAAPIAGLIGLSAGVGLNGLLLIYFFIRMAVRARGPFWHVFFFVNAIGLVVMGIALLVWLRRWRWIRGRELPVRWAWVGACWILALADIIVFSVVIR
jgi:hypothetical protein